MPAESQNTRYKYFFAKKKVTYKHMLKNYKQVPINVYRHFMHDTFRRNSSFLIGGQLISAGSAFIFWIICARLFSANDVGLATAFVSYATLVATFTTLGMPTTIIRFLPQTNNKSRLLLTAFGLVLALSLVGALVSLILINIVAPDLNIVTSSTALTAMLCILIVVNAISPLMDNTFMAYRKGEYIFVKNLIVSIPRIILPFVFVGLALKGIVSIFVIIALISITYGLFILRTKIALEKSGSLQNELASHKGFAVRNYIGGLTGILPSTLVPIIVLNNLGASSAAYFYIPLQMAALLSVISGSVSQAFVSEASQKDDIKMHTKQLRNAIKHLFRLLVPAVFLLIFFGWFALRLYGQAYATNGYLPLVILAIAGLFIGVNWLGDTWLIIIKKMNSYMAMNAFNSLLVVGLVVILSKHGLFATAMAWLVAQIITMIVYVSIFMRKYLFGYFSRNTSS